MLRLTLIVLALAVAGSAMAASYVVEPDGSGDFPTIQAALDAAASMVPCLSLAAARYLMVFRMIKNRTLTRVA